MCGICGFVSKDTLSEELANDKLDAMLSVLEKRGPDAYGKKLVYNKDSLVALGHRRLSIIDLSSKAEQPMEDDVSIVSFNGCIYNYKVLRQNLIDKFAIKFNSTSDTEVIIAAYKVFGESAFEQLDGMFAFALLDKNNNKLYLVRDRLGIKPLYYALYNNNLVFASNTPAILKQDKTAGFKAQLDLSLNPDSLNHIFSLHGVSPDERSILKSIKKIPAAAFARIDLAKPNLTLDQKFYWQLKKNPDVSNLSANEILETTENLLEEAVLKRARAADVDFGIFLSGGLDSSYLVALLAKHGFKDLKTFSVGFADAVLDNGSKEEGSEFIFSDMIAKKFNTNHHKYEFSNGSIINFLPEVYKNLSEPLFAQDTLGFYLLSKSVAAESTKVVLSGQGADELFGGYFWYPQIFNENSPTSAIGKNFDLLEKYYLDRVDADLGKMLNQDFLSKNATRDWFYGKVDKYLKNNPDDNFINMLFHLDITSLIVDDPVKRVDNMTMANSLEARVPFLDHKLIEFVFSIKADLKLAKSQQTSGKDILKTISRGLVPDAIIDRKKEYFPLPALKFLRGDFYDFIRDILLSKKCLERGLYNRSYVEKLLANPESKDSFTKIQGSKLWHLAALELWLQQAL